MPTYTCGRPTYTTGGTGTTPTTWVSYNSASTTCCYVINDPWECWHITNEQNATYRAALAQATEYRRVEHEHAMAQIQRANEVMIKQQKLMAGATKKARELLLEHLDERQRKDYEEKQRFFVVSQSGKKFEIICSGGNAGNVRIYNDKGKPIASACCHAKTQMPIEDHFLVQLLNIKFNEEEFLNQANLSSIAA